jgi:hypothetical protein
MLLKNLIERKTLKEEVLPHATAKKAIMYGIPPL